MTPTGATLRGILPIPVTTFTSSGELDLDGLRSQVDFCLGAGAHGLVYPGVVSEFYTLTDQERYTAVQTCVDAVAGRVPVVVGVSASSTAASVAFARQAAELHVDAVMTMSPFVQHFFSPSADYVLQHVAAVAAAAAVPVILQNARIGFPIGVSAVASLVDQVPQVRYIKQEPNPPTHAISELIESVGDRVDGVFGGVGCIYLVNELERGAAGSMPAPAVVDRIVEAYTAYGADGPQAAQAILDPLGTLFTRELLYNAVFIKEILRRRGVISSGMVRIASPAMDRCDLEDLDRILASVGLA